jgi:hypothetical protein
MAEAGAAYELTEVRRFRAEWERGASLRLRDGDETVLGDYHKHGRIVDAGTREQAETAAGKAWLADTLDGQHSILIVDTNEQAAHLCAELRNELIRLGKVADTGVPLGKQGTYAGVGDLIQARRNGWQLAGVDGNQEVPINRKQYRVLDTREDGGLIVAHVLGREDGVGEVLGERITLPGSYVAEHVALGYASTVHSAQGLTVDTSHAVVTDATGAEALYVGLTRGRHGNTAHVTTTAVPADAPDGAALAAVHRSPAAVLAGAFAGAGPQRSALAQATESAIETEAIRTPAELLADATELATAGRTARWLDDLVETGHLSENQRARIAAEDGGPTLARLLRRAELAGHDPRQVLENAVTTRDLSGSRQLTNVIHHRITSATTLDPVGDSYADWIPQVDDPQWATYLRSLADTADARRHELGRQLVTEPQQWAIEAFGPIPEDPAERTKWAQRAEIVAGHRELTGFEDLETALDAAPKSGQVEAFASWRAAWRALGRPESGRDELEMSDGQLLVRMRAWEREKVWGPEFVANELAGTHQAVATRRQQAAMRRAEADASTDDTERDRLLHEAADAEALAGVLGQRAAELETADEARALWYAHTAETRAAADRASAEISARNLDAEPVQTVTAAEWLQVHHEHIAVEDVHREVTAEHDLADTVEQRAEDLAAVEQPTAAGDDVTETEVADIRDLAADAEPVTESDEVRVPSADEAADTIDRAQGVLREIEARQAAEARYADEQAQAEEMYRRNTADAAEAAVDDDAAVR